MKRTVLYLPIGVPTFDLEAAKNVFEMTKSALTNIVSNIVLPDAMLLSTDDLKAFISDQNPDLIVLQHVTFAERHWASAWWIDNVLGSHYDYLAYGRLILKRIFGDVWKRAAGWRWAWWCTEGTRDMWIKPKQITREIDPWKKSNPTPLTTEHRVIDGRLIAVDFKSS